MHIYMFIYPFYIEGGGGVTISYLNPYSLGLHGVGKL